MCLTEGKKEGKRGEEERDWANGIIGKNFPRTKGEKTLLTNVMGMQRKGMAFLSVAFLSFLLLLYFYLKKMY